MAKESGYVIDFVCDNNTDYVNFSPYALKFGYYWSSLDGATLFKTKEEAEKALKKVMYSELSKVVFITRNKIPKESGYAIDHVNEFETRWVEFKTKEKSGIYLGWLNKATLFKNKKDAKKALKKMMFPDKSKIVYVTRNKAKGNNG